MKLLINILIIFIVIVPEKSFADKASKLNKNGIESYNEKKLEESINLFTDALVERPDSPELRFNRGTALSTAGKSEEAITELEKSADTFKKSELSAAAHFNAGNTYLASGDINGAIEEYKKAVKLDQSSKDIRNNLELALRMLQKQQQKEQQEKKETEQNKENNDQTKQDQEENKDERQNENNKQQNEQEQESQQQENEPQSMTPEEAKRILDAIDKEEEKAFELRKMKTLNEMRQGDDW